MQMKRMRPLGNGYLGIWTSFALLCSTTSALAEDSGAVCTEFRKLLDLPSREQLNRHWLDRSAPLGGTEADEQYFNVDIDGDDISDYLQSGCSRSTMPADPCFILVKLTSGGDFTHEFESDEYFSLLRFKSQVFVQIDRGSPEAKPGNRKLLQIDKSGIQVVCADI